MKPPTRRPHQLALFASTLLVIALTYLLFARAHRQEELDQHLLDAVCDRDTKRVESLLAKGANPDVRFVAKIIYRQGAPYRLNVTATQATILDKLVSIFVMHKSTTLPGEPCLMLALSYSNRATHSRHNAALDSEALVRLLLEHGADANATDSNGASALMLATDLDNIPLTRLLLDHGADPNFKWNGGDTALTRACACDDVGIVQLLLDHGADVNQRSNDGRTLFQHVTRNGNEGKEIIKLLTQRGAPIM